MTKEEYGKKLDALRRAAREGNLQEVSRIAKELGDFFHHIAEDASELSWARELAKWYADRYPDKREP